MLKFTNSNLYISSKMYFNTVTPKCSLIISRCEIISVPYSSSQDDNNFEIRIPFLRRGAKDTRGTFKIWLKKKKTNQDKQKNNSNKPSPTIDAIGMLTDAEEEWAHMLQPLCCTVYYKSGKKMYSVGHIRSNIPNFNFANFPCLYLYMAFVCLSSDWCYN